MIEPDMNCSLARPWRYDFTFMDTGKTRTPPKSAALGSMPASNKPVPATDLKSYIAKIPTLSPKQMFDLITENGYIGQVQARKAICLMAYRHINRLRKLYLEDIPRHLLPSKENYLLIGPTGSGKTFLIELLFQKVLKIPTVIIDITSYSETGYIGQDVPTIITRLIHAAEGDIRVASIGIVCIDEFDKIATGHNNAIFAGQGTTKDVTGMGVQRELLKMLEASSIVVPLNLTHSTYADRVAFDTGDVPFIACGAFSGFQKVIDSQNGGMNVGFGAKTGKRARDGISVPLTREDIERAANFELYGIRPELIGRFSRIIPFNPLSEVDLKNILRQNTIQRYENELKLDGIGLEVQEEVYDFIVKDCIKKETGARGLKSLVTEYLEDACFDVYSANGCKNIKLFVEDKEIHWTTY
jgi:ATP-dependent Clp protease ATP-binding subunit ClpX